jgi:hypothetical protein
MRTVPQLEAPMSSFPESAVPGRRRFLKVVGLAGLSSTLAAPLAFAQAGDSPKAKEPAKPRAKPAPPPEPPAAEPPEISDEGRALAEVVRQRYGRHLSAEQMTEIEKELTWRMRAGAALRQFKLGNGEEPDFTFRA